MQPDATQLAWIWTEFAACAAAIGWAGLALVRHGDAIAAGTGLSRSWVGLVLVAAVTSLPELVTGVSAVAVAQAPDIAAGDALGSCAFNLAILALLDLGSARRESLHARLAPSHRVAIGHGITMLAIVGLSMLASHRFELPMLGPSSVFAPLLLGGYLAAMRALFRMEQAPAPAASAATTTSLKRAILGYSVAGTAILAAGVWLSVLSVELAQAMGWTHSFVGSTFVAIATSVPELATTWAAMRRGAVEIAAGNLLGSNLFDLLILALDDLAYPAGSLFAAMSLRHLGTVLAVMAMSGVLVAAAARPPASRHRWVAKWPSALLLALYAANIVVQFDVPR